MNTDQGSQFTSSAFIGVLQENRIQISMDGKGCWRDNVFVERLWKSVKYEEVYLHGYETVSAPGKHWPAISISTTAVARIQRLTEKPRHGLLQPQQAAARRGGLKPGRNIT
jgi:transposase InsO family protein